jgi:hypothetical protein
LLLADFVKHVYWERYIGGYQTISNGREIGHASFEPIYYLVFPPSQILEVKRQIPAWIAGLRNDGWNVTTFSIAEAIDRILESDPRRPFWLAADRKGSFGLGSNKPGACQGAYRPRQPDENPLYRVAAGNLETFLARQRERHRHVPGFVEREFRSFLDCGVLCRGTCNVCCLTFRFSDSIRRSTEADGVGETLGQWNCAATASQQPNERGNHGRHSKADMIAKALTKVSAFLKQIVTIQPNHSCDSRCRPARL